MTGDQYPHFPYPKPGDIFKPAIFAANYPGEIVFREPQPHSIYLIGSLRNPAIPEIAGMLREAGHYVFDDWFAAGPEADDMWQRYEKARGHTYAEALEGHAAVHVFDFDFYHLDKADTVVLALPAGKSGHMEFGWALGQGKRGYVLFDGEPERWDVMYQFATDVCFSRSELLSVLDCGEVL